MIASRNKTLTTCRWRKSFSRNGRTWRKSFSRSVRPHLHGVTSQKTEVLVIMQSIL